VILRGLRPGLWVLTTDNRLFWVPPTSGAIQAWMRSGKARRWFLRLRTGPGAGPVASPRSLSQA